MTNELSTVNIPTKPADRRAWIIYQLRLRGSSLSAFALAEGVCFQAVSKVAGGEASSHLQDALASFLGVKTPILFPEHFDCHGNRKGRTRTKQRITREDRINVQDGAAA